jgi:hypothetical protein
LVKLPNLFLALVFVLRIQCYGQQATPTANPAPKEDKRLFWIVPNFRTSPTLHPYTPLTTAEKFKLSTQDAFDPGTMALAAIFAGEAQLTDSNPSFGQGVSGYASNLGTAYADLVIGDYMTEAIFPTIFHQDPRYFRRATGSGWSRLMYAAGQIFLTHTDTGSTTVNYSEILGNSTAVAISNAYYPDHRSAGDAASKLGIQLGVDMGSNILKEFWPEISRKFFKKQSSAKDPPGH